LGIPLTLIDEKLQRNEDGENEYWSIWSVNLFSRKLESLSLDIYSFKKSYMKIYYYKYFEHNSCLKLCEIVVDNLFWAMKK